MFSLPPLFQGPSSLQAVVAVAVLTAVLCCVFAPRTAVAHENVYTKERGVRALYIFGDSLVDVGNNHYLPLSIIRADFPHNGIDFPGKKATGRFSNGKNAADFIAMNLGLESPPAYLSLSDAPDRTRTFLAGVNFASGGAGISDDTARELEQCLPVNKQLDYFSEVRQALVCQLGVEKAKKHLSRSLFVLVIGSNDIFRYVKCEHECPLQLFVDSMALALERQLKRMHDLGARMLVFVGTGPVGCCPSHRVWNKTGDCHDLANHISLRYNEAVYRVLQKIKAERGDFCYSFFDTYKVVMDYIQNPEAYGFAEGRAACCGLGTLNAKVACLPISSFCDDRKAHVFWDFHHPTERTYEMLANVIFRGSKEYVFPVNAGQLTSL
ncbi:hypothetical protein Taro_017415 [Colocasia esculenta]|uniref:GDSL esterase/lipase n=1 Tax=Colocasia esculenta TaxID=4460 RepID=A0A843UNK2_COLES|nr:hypothetical protein [Colocasia esculenta]